MDQQSSLYLRDSELGGHVSKLGWSGSLAQPDCPTGFGHECVIDQIYQVEANVGVNKINAYVNQSVTHAIEITQDKVHHQRQIKYSNKARSNIWPFGSYKFYLRFYVNAESSLEKITVNNNELGEDRVVNYIDHNRQVYGVVSEVAVGEELEIVLHYSTPLEVTAEKSYFFYDQMQPGLKKRPTVISVRHPSEMSINRISPQAEINKNQLVVTSDVGSGYVVIKFN